MSESLELLVRRAALQNASEHGGKTSVKIVMGKVLGSNPGLRGDVAGVSRKAAEIVDSVNAMSQEEQRGEVEERFPELLERRKREGRDGLPELDGARHGMVVTRFPPEPNGYPHIGHAKAAIINEEYARMYGGKFILRMDDTNPEAERMEYHAAIKVGLEWLGVKPDVTENTSDRMETFYEKAGDLIRMGKAYVCTCKKEKISENRKRRAPCGCRGADERKSADMWEGMHKKYKHGEAVLRYRGDMGSDNAVMRDPVLFRVVTEKHYTKGNRYRVWPSYDFAVAITDSIDGVTHAFRSKEFELREELTESVLGDLDMAKPAQGFFSRLEFQGMPTSKRLIRALIDERRVMWYDDPRLPTLEGLKARGIRPEAIRRFVLSLGLTKADTTASFETLESFNRTIIDPQSIRLFMAGYPLELEVDGIPFSSVDMPNHPAADMGSRKIEVDGKFYIAGQDAHELEEGSTVRLIGIGDITVTKKGEMIRARFAEGRAPEARKIQWVPQNGAHGIRVLIPKLLFDGEVFDDRSLEEMPAYTEPHYLDLKDGSQIQFVRFGYCKKSSQNIAIFTHK